MKVAFLLALAMAIGAGIMALNFRSQLLQAQLQLKILNAARTDAVAASASQASREALEAERQKKEKLELLELRSQVTQLQGQAKDMETLKQQNQSLSAANKQLRSVSVPQTPQPNNANPALNVFAKENWTFAGYETPESSLVSAIWAMKEGDPKVYFDSLSPEEQERISQSWEGKSLDAVAAKQKSDVEKITGIQVMEKQQINDDEVQLSVYIQGVDRMDKVKVKRSEDGWKFGGFIRPGAPPPPVNLTPQDQ